MIPGYAVGTYQPPLNDLGGFFSVPSGQSGFYPYSGAKTANSTIYAVSDGGEFVFVGTTGVSVTFNSGNDDRAITITETLPGSPNSPRVSYIQVDVYQPFTITTSTVGSNLGGMQSGSYGIIWNFGGWKHPQTSVIISSNMKAGGYISISPDDPTTSDYKLTFNIPAPAYGHGNWSGWVDVTQHSPYATNSRTTRHTFSVYD